MTKDHEHKEQWMSRLSDTDIQHLQQYARRYADGRSTYAATEVNDITARMIDAGIMPIPDNSGDVFAADGSFASVKAGYVDKYGADGRKGK